MLVYFFQKSLQWQCWSWQGESKSCHVHIKMDGPGQRLKKPFFTSNTHNGYLGEQQQQHLLMPLCCNGTECSKMWSGKEKGAQKIAVKFFSQPLARPIQDFVACVVNLRSKSRPQWKMTEGQGKRKRCTHPQIRVTFASMSQSRSFRRFLNDY